MIDLPEPNKPLQRICILRLSALGDCVLLLPAIRRIQRSFPKAEISWIIGESVYPLFKDIEGINFIPIKKPRSFSDYRQLRRSLKAYDFDILLAMQASLRVNMIVPLVQARIKLGFDKRRANDMHGFFVNDRIEPSEEHLLDGFRAFANRLEVLFDAVQQDQGPPIWDIKLPEEDRVWAQSQLSRESGEELSGLDTSKQGDPKWIAINPAASKLERCCPIELYTNILLKLDKMGLAEGRQLNIVLTGGPADFEIKLATELEKSLAGQVTITNLVGRTSLTQLAALLSEVDLLIAPDTGPVHIADALGTPVVGLYAVAPPELTGPYQSLDLVVNKYPEAVSLFLKKDPLKVKWGSRVHHPLAMTLFKADEVLEKVSLVLNRGSDNVL